MLELYGTFYLELDEVLILHGLIFQCTPEEARFRLRGGGAEGLASALGRPWNMAYYEDADLASQAGVLVHGIAEGQHFVEGNKRTAHAACTMFLDENGYVLTAPFDDVRTWILEFSGGDDADLQAAERLTSEGFAERARPWIKKRIA